MALDAKVGTMATTALHGICPSFDGVEEAKAAFVHARVDRIAASVTIHAFLLVMAILTAFRFGVAGGRMSRLPAGAVIVGQERPKVAVAVPAAARRRQHFVLAGQVARVAGRASRVERLQRERLGKLFVFGFDPQGEDVAVHTGHPFFSKGALVHCVIEALARIAGTASQCLVCARLQVSVRGHPLAARSHASAHNHERAAPTQ